MKTAIYVRTSTQDQTYEQQVEACKQFCKFKGWNDVDIYTEKMSSMKARPVFQEVLRRTRQGDYGVIIVFRLDRAWRSSRQFIMDFDNLQSQGKYVISITEGIDPTTPVGKCMMTILVALAELERVQISEATQQRLTALKHLGKKLGRPYGSCDKGKRRKSGYQLRWSKQTGSNKSNEIVPINVRLE
jgi:DNA invertase Pin-like site-specific DNA recombinase